MTDGHPLVSILMTAFNRENYIREAIESVLASTYKNFELIVVDDCSSDRTVEIAKSYAFLDKRVKVFMNETNLGDYPNRNKAASYASGDYLLYVDSDDKIYPHTLFVMMQGVQKFPDAALFMAVRAIDETLPCFQYLDSRQAYDLHFHGNGFMESGPLGVLISNDVFRAVGGFSGRRMIGDTELWLKIARQYPVVRLEKNMVFWRQHEGQEYAAGLKFYLVDALQMYREALYHPQSPLGLETGRHLYRKLKRKNYFLLLRHFLKNGRLKELLGYLKEIKALD